MFVYYAYVNILTVTVKAGLHYETRLQAANRLGNSKPDDVACDTCCISPLCNMITAAGR